MDELTEWLLRAEGGEGEGCPACHEADAADGGDCAEDADTGEREDVEAAAEEHCAKREERGGDGEGASLPALEEQAGGKQGEGVVHLEAGGGLEGAECVCVQGVAQACVPAAPAMTARRPRIAAMAIVVAGRVMVLTRRISLP